MATTQVIKLHGKQKITVSSTPVEAQYMERNKYYIKKGGKSVVRALEVNLSGKTVDVLYMESGQKRKWPKTTIVFEVLDRDKMYRMKQRSK
jgi:hypothetical protein